MAMAAGGTTVGAVPTMGVSRASLVLTTNKRPLAHIDLSASIPKLRCGAVLARTGGSHALCFQAADATRSSDSHTNRTEPEEAETDSDDEMTARRVTCIVVARPTPMHMDAQAG